MVIRKRIINGGEYYQLYQGNKFVRHIGNREAYEKYLKDVAKKERELTALNSSNKVPTPDMPQGKYDVIYADPPWRYDNPFHLQKRPAKNPTVSIGTFGELSLWNKGTIFKGGK